VKKQLLALTALCLAALTGCEGGVAPAPTPAPVTVSVLYGESTTDPGLEDMFTGSLAGRFPDVELDWESVDWGERFSSTLEMRIAAGEVPDILIGKSQDVRAFQPAGILAPFSEALSRKIQPYALPQVSKDGEVYGLPYNMFYQGVLYNRDIFDRLGLAVPRTREQLDAVVKTLEKAGVTPFGTHFQEVWYTGNILMQFAANDVFRENPGWGDDFRAGKASYSDSPLWRDCYRQAKYALDHSWADAPSIAQVEADRRFASGGCAMYLTGSWSIQAILTIAPQSRLGIFPYPNATGDAKLIFEPNITFMMSASSAHRDLIEQMIGALLSDQELAESALQFTQADSLLTGVSSDTLSIIRDSIDFYKGGGEMLDASVGNGQLVWQFQYGCAEAALEWLKGNGTLEAALRYADQHRAASGA